MLNMPFYLQMLTNINSTTRHLRFSYISILTNLLRTDNETKSVKTRSNMQLDQLEKIKKDKE